jgi:hypothetical protein
MGIEKLEVTIRMVVDKKQFFFKNLCRIKIEKENKIKD